MKLHIVKILSTGCSCSCGFSKTTVTGAQGSRLAYLHARAEAPSLVRDMRGWTQDCINSFTRARIQERKFHIEDCPNFGKSDQEIESGAVKASPKTHDFNIGKTKTMGQHFKITH